MGEHHLIHQLGHDDDDAFGFSGWSSSSHQVLFALLILCVNTNEISKGIVWEQTHFLAYRLPKCNKSCRIFYRISTPVGPLIKRF